VQPQKVKEGETATAPANPAKTGFVFMFWHLNGAATAYNFETPVNSDITLTAKWEEEAVVEYWQVTWNLNGGAFPTPSNHATQVVKGGTLAEPNDPTKENAEFDGWYKEAALTNKVTFPYDVSGVTANITLYAKWESDGGGGDPDGYQVFTSIAELKTWLDKQPLFNDEETAHKIRLKGVNLDAGNNWGDLGIAIGSYKYVHLDLSGCTGATMPDGYYSNPNTYGVFAGCQILSIDLPATLRHIGMYAFYRTPIETITLPEGMTAVGERAFSGNSYIESVILPESITSIENSAFRGCSGLASINFPNGLVSIGDDAFNGCKLESLEFHAGLKTIGGSAFQSNKSLVSVIIPEGVETIGIYAFSSCSALTDVSLPNGLKIISRDLFSHCTKLKKITIPASVTAIEAVVFQGSGLTEIIMLPIIPPTLGNQALTNPLIKVPASSLSDYKTASGWSDHAGRIVANE
jgi:uncharacterized repeat protein (TIGR02543 family)